MLEVKRLIFLDKKSIKEFKIIEKKIKVNILKITESIRVLFDKNRL